MAKKDLFKIDNYFIRIGILFLIAGSISLAVDPRSYNDLTISEGTNSYFEDFDGRTLEDIQEEKGSQAEITVHGFPIIRSVMATSGLALLVIGMNVRRKENKIISIWDCLERTSVSKLNDMVVSLGLSKDFILQNLKHINAQQNTYYVYLSDKDTIVDGRLLTEHVVAVNCKGCGSKSSQTVTLAALNTPTCSYCGMSIEAGELSKMRHEILDKEENSIVIKSGFSVPIFIALLIFFWPGALIYLAIKKSGSTKQVVQKMQEFQTQAKKQMTAS